MHNMCYQVLYFVVLPFLFFFFFSNKILSICVTISVKTGTEKFKLSKLFSIVKIPRKYHKIKTQTVYLQKEV